MPITEVAPVSSLGDLLRTTKKVREEWIDGPEPREELWFRGLRSKDHDLTPSLYRKSSIERGFDQVESSLLHDFQLRAAGVAGNSASTHYNDRDWYAAARHHGLPSRLMDWSGNILIALFFALEQSWGRMEKRLWTETRDSRLAAELAVAEPWICIMEAGSLNALALGHDNIVSLNSKETFLDSYFPPKGCATIQPEDQNALPIALYPSRSHERISAQHGYFTLHGVDRRSLESIASLPETNALRLARIPIDATAIPSLIDDLIICGISHASVYADRDSIARSVQWAYMQGGALDG
jgi:hypothetical protein